MTDASPAQATKMPTSLTPWQKLNSLAMRFYQGNVWHPRAGDYYTTSRADLELYQVVEVQNGSVITRYCDPEKGASLTAWHESEFLSPETFGGKRVYVHPAFLKPDPREVQS